MKYIESKNQLQNQSKRGITLAELMVSITVFSVFMTGLMSVMLFGLNTSSRSTGKLLVNRDIRNFTNKMAENARFSDYFVIFDSFTARDQKNDGLSGDFLVLVHRDIADPEKINRIVGYYRHSTVADNEGPLLMFDSTYSPASSIELLSLLPEIETNGSHQEVIELSEGLSDGKLFYNFYDRSIIVRGEIIHDGAINEQVTNTYNFTISPRG